MVGGVKALNIKSFAIGVLLTIIAVLLFQYISFPSRLFVKTYDFYADFNNVHNLQIGDPVKLNGMPIGWVSAFRRVEKDDNARAIPAPVRVTLSIQEKHASLINEGSIAAVNFYGLSNENFMSINPGAESVVLKPHSMLRTDETADINTLLSAMNEAAGGIVTVSDSFKGVEIVDVLGPMEHFFNALAKDMVPPKKWEVRYFMVDAQSRQSHEIEEGWEPIGVNDDNNILAKRRID